MEQEINKIMQRFLQHGFQIYLVGGYVRDCVLGTTAKDIDFATDALPEQVEQLFPKTLALGKQFGTITLVMESGSYEVTTFRQDLENDNFRKPRSVAYAHTLAEDVARRDLTINGLAMTIDGTLIDLVGGQEDIKAKIIRTIGEPTQRFHEDALRILRALRFAMRFNFTLAPETLAAMEECAPYLQAIAPERLRKEWEQILAAPYYDANRVPKLIGEVCFGDSWRRIAQFPSENPVSLTQFWTFVALVSQNDWRYTKQEQRLYRQVQQRQHLPISLRYLELSEEEACQLERLRSAYQQEQFDIGKVKESYQHLLIHQRQELPVTAADWHLLGLEVTQFQRAFHYCIQAINERQILNTKQACLAYIKGVPWINN